jgi:hypothetical protein
MCPELENKKLITTLKFKKKNEKTIFKNEILSDFFPMEAHKDHNYKHFL